VIILLPLYDCFFHSFLRIKLIESPPCQQMRLLKKCVRDMVIKKSFYHLTRKFYKIQLNKLNEMKTFSLNSLFQFAFAVCLIFSRSQSQKNGRKKRKSEVESYKKFHGKKKKNYLDGMSRMRDGELKKLQHLVIQIITL
jgi:hypothetical protein